jgi:N-ethylmaleimide reductase
MRFALDVATAVTKAIGADKTGIRISPYGVFNDMGAFEGIESFFTELTQKLSALGLLYVHVVDHAAMGAPPVNPEVKELIRKNFKGDYILSGGYDAKTGERDLSAQKGTLVAFGRPFIANPNLVEKLEKNIPLKEADQTKFYTPGAEGYTNY